MAVNKVKLSNGEVLIDISGDTVKPETLAEGVTAHNAVGERIIGTMPVEIIPEYWKTALEEGAEAINTALGKAGRNKSAFLFYTDAHWGYGSGMSPKLLKYLGKHTGINKTIFGGDFGNTYEYPDTGKTMDDWADVMREWKLAVRDIPNHHSVVGNHDKEVDAFNTDKSLYGFLFAPEETNDIVRGGDFFYYIDDVNEKTRYFYLNTGLIDFSDEQCAFLIEGLTSVPSGWHIVAVSHIWFVYNSISTPTEGSVPANTQKVLNLLEAYNSRSFGSVTIESKACEYDFSNCEGWFEFCIGGHTHVDHSFTSAMGIPIILCPTDSKHTRGADKFVTGTTSEACVSGIIADYDNRKVYIVRVGRGDSREVELTWYEVSYTNILSTALGADGVSIYNGKGWKENTRWSQSGQSESNSTGTYLTGWIPIKKGDVIRMKNMTTLSSNFVLLLSNAPGSTSGSNDHTGVQQHLNAIVDDAGNIIQFTWSGDASYFRIVCGGISDASIITKNEPIE